MSNEKQLIIIFVFENWFRPIQTHNGLAW